MIKYNLNNINKWYLGNGNPIAKMYHGSTVAFDITGGGEPTPPTPSFDGKWLATYSDGHTESATCGSISAITVGEITSTDLVDVQIGQCVLGIGYNAFVGCNGLTSVTIPNSVISIGNSAFSYCSDLTSIDIPSGVTSIGTYAFYSCSGLTKIDIPSGVTSIGNNTFDGCRSLTSVTIPDSVTNIGIQAFAFCSGLTSCTIGSGVTSIGQSAFNSCSGLTGVTCNALQPPTLGGGAFGYTNNCPIYVPSESLNNYITASDWSRYADRIQAIPT